MIVRPACIDDARSIADMHTETWKSAYAGLLPEPYLVQLSAEDCEMRWRENLAQGAFETLLAMRDHRVMGFCSHGACRDADAVAGISGEVLAIYVRPSEWGAGVGRTLLQCALDKLHADGFWIATRWVLAGNWRARRFYERAGFSEDGQSETRVWDGVELCEIRYRKELSTVASLARAD